jgi:thiamine biosynthesis lipoprotein
MLHRFQHTAMAAQFEIRCTHPDEHYAGQAARAAFEAVDRLEQQLSRFVENSDISRVNHLSAGEEAKVGYETMECLRLARLAWEQTGGAFDASIGTGFERLELVPEEFVVRARAQRVEAPTLGPSDPRTFGLSDLRLDLGAIGKGYAVDRIADVLEDWNVDQVLIDAGYSSVLALEPPPGRDAWPLTLSIPGDASGAALVRIAARQHALGASGIVKRDHIRDPRTQTPVRARQAAWVYAPRQVLGEITHASGVEASPAALADALSTAFMIMSGDEIDRYCHRHPGVEAWVFEGGLTHFFCQSL